MRRRALAVATAQICSAILFAATVVPLSDASDDGAAKGRPADPGVFGLTKVLPVHIQIPADEFRAMQPPAPAGGPGGGPGPAARPKKPGERESERNLFGVEFPWAAGPSRPRERRFRESDFATRGTPPTWPPPGA